MKDIFKKAVIESQKDKPKIKEWQFINWLCSKRKILTDPIIPIEEYEKTESKNN